MESTTMMMIGRMVRGGIWVVLMGVAMGSLMMWIMMPTNIYRNHWYDSIHKEVNNSTFIGTQGSTLLIYTFPILFFASLSCVYLHIGKKLDDLQKIYMGSDGKKELLGRWKRPLLVRAPLGIVSGIELSFFLMFMALLLWSLWTYLHNNFSNIHPAFFTKDDLKLWQVKLEIAGFFIGRVGNIALTFLFFPVTRGSSVLALFGLTSEASIKYHIWLGHIAMVLFTAHGICYIIFWGITHEISECKNDEEIVAVIAHELGHWKLNHTMYSFIAVQILTFLQFGGYTLVRNSSDLFRSFGFDTQPVLIGLIIFQHTVIPLQHLVSFGLNLVSRSFEFQADAFAKKLGYAAALRAGLVKLQEENLSAMNTDPWYSAYHYSHPPLVERLAALDEPGKKVD